MARDLRKTIGQMLPPLREHREVLGRLSRSCRERRISAGALLLREGEPADTLVGLISGEAEVLRRFGDTDRVIGLIGEGGLIGEASLCGDRHRTASVRARTTLQIFDLPASEVRWAMQEVPALALALLDRVMQRLQARDVAYLSALQRSIVRRDKELAELRLAAGGQQPSEAIWCPSLEPLLDRARRIARSDIPVLITGESGTGKELLAQLVHRESARASAPLRALNCAALPAEIAEAELFGAARGAYTGAHRDRPGLLRAAHGGSFFLDEIGDLPLPQQAKLLRVLQDGTFYPLGSDEPAHADIRLISATHRDLREAAGAGRFREDLLYRIEGAQLSLPPLRDRPDHIPLLVDWFVSRAIPEADPSYVVQEVMPFLLQYPWPGNVRELLSVLRAAMVITEDFPRLRPSDLPPRLRGQVREVNGDSSSASQGISHSSVAQILRGRSLPEHQRQELKTMIRRALEEHGWVRTRAAAALGMTPQNLSNYIRRLGLERLPESRSGQVE